MANAYLPVASDDLAPVELWRLDYQQRIDRATESRDQRLLQKLHGFGRWSTILVDFLLLIVFEVVVSILLVIGAVLIIGIHDGDFSGGASRHGTVSTAAKSAQDWLMSSYGLAIGGLIVQLGIFGIITLRVVAPRVLSWADIGFGRALRNRPGRALAIGVVAAIAAIVCSAIVVAVLQALKLPVNGQQDTLKPLRHAGTAQQIAVAISVVGLAPLAEETFFRAYMLRALAVRYGVLPGIAVTAAEFGALHLLGGVTFEFIAIGVVGAILAITYARTGNLLSNLTAHALFNTVGLVVLYKG